LLSASCLASTSCDVELARPDDACSAHDGDSTACWQAVDADGNACAFVYVGDGCAGQSEPFGCFGPAFIRCETDAECPPAHDCVEQDVTTCAPNAQGMACAACGVTTRGMCFAE
jgi:hypothetical protein